MQNFDLNSPQIVRVARLLTMAPGDSLLSDGAVLVDGGIVVEAGRYADILRAHSGVAVRDMGDVTLVPGLLNVHCHLGMCHLLGKLDSGLGFSGWIRQMVAAGMHDLERTLVADALKQMGRWGICFVGDIATHHVENIAGILDESGFFFVAFKEHIFFSPLEPGREYIPDGSFDLGMFSGAGHAPYSTHPDILRGVKAQCRAMARPFSMHLAENEEESALLMGQDNAFQRLLEQASIPLNDFQPPMVRPVEYARDLGLLDDSTLAVHCVTISDADIAILRETGTNVCLCPRSNEYIGVGRAPWEKLLAAGVNCCLGTDSLASNHDLNLWNELRFMKERFAGELTLEQGIELLTVHPARAMGVDALGTIAPGKAARFATIPKDIEEMFAGS